MEPISSRTADGMELKEVGHAEILMKVVVTLTDDFMMISA